MYYFKNWYKNIVNWIWFTKVYKLSTTCLGGLHLHESYGALA